MTTSTEPLPKHLHAAYDWTAAAGELEKLSGLHDRRLASYARESEANARQNDVTDVHASDIKELATWLQLTKHRATKKSPAQLQREIDETLGRKAAPSRSHATKASVTTAQRFAPGTRVRLTGGDNDEAIGLEGTIVDAPTRTWDRPAAWRRGGAWVEWDGLADPSWEKLEWLTPVK